jgi:serine protease inhibitor
MVVDRPFFLLVGHRATGAVLFLARVADPQGGV